MPADSSSARASLVRDFCPAKTIVLCEIVERGFVQRVCRRGCSCRMYSHCAELHGSNFTEARKADNCAKMSRLCFQRGIPGVLGMAISPNPNIYECSNQKIKIYNVHTHTSIFLSPYFSQCCSAPHNYNHKSHHHYHHRASSTIKTYCMLVTC